jgi:hypothetical protein
MPVSGVTQSFAPVAFDGDFVCGNGLKPFPPKPKLEAVSAELLKNVLTTGRGAASAALDDYELCPRWPIPPRPHFSDAELLGQQVIR